MKQADARAECAAASMPLRIRVLRRPEQFSACFSARSVQHGEFRLHYRAALDAETRDGPAGLACWLGLVVPKKFCKQAVRRNLIKRAMRQALRDLRLPQSGRLQAPVLMLRLTRKLPAEFRSARSPALAAYVRAAVNDLVAAWIQRSLIVAERGAA